MNFCCGSPKSKSGLIFWSFQHSCSDTSLPKVSGTQNAGTEPYNAMDVMGHETWQWKS